jgi:hypothetical protein
MNSTIFLLSCLYLLKLVFYALYVIYDVLNSCMYKLRCVIISLKMANARRNIYKSLFVQITCNILILCVHLLVCIINYSHTEMNE